MGINEIALFEHLALTGLFLHPKSPIKPLISEVFSEFLLQHRRQPIVLNQSELELTRIIISFSVSNYSVKVEIYDLFG